MTPHINAPAGAFAETVLMPGDPLRAKYIAETYFENPTEITNVRNMLGFSGTYKGKKVSVLAHGMGIPSVSIYATELIKFYGVKNIIRVGSCGAVLDNVNVRDVVIALGASTDSQVNRMRFGGYDFSATADFGITSALVASAQKLNISAKVGNIFSADLFYDPTPNKFDLLRKYNVLAVEMEAAGLFGVAHEYGAKAGCILTVSDHIIKGEQTTPAERQTTFNQMMEIALDTAITL